MPRTLVRADAHDRDRSLGWLATAWMEFFLVHGPGDVQGEPVRHGDEYTGFIADCYALDERGRRHYDSAFISRPKGCDKSGLGSRFGTFEALGPCRFAGWARGGEVYRDPWGLGFSYRYTRGEPMGRPVKSPYIRIMATEEGQTGNVFDSIYLNLTEGLLSEVPGLDVGLTRIYLPDGGEITPSTASSAAKDGGKETYVDFDESHLYNTPELRRMYATVTRNMRKRAKEAEPWYLETTTMFAAGEDSIAEATYRLSELILQGRARRPRLLCDHRWGDCEDLTDEPALRAALIEAYGDAIEWIDVEALIDEFYDPRKHPEDSRRFFLNAETATKDAWITPTQWKDCASDKALADGDVVTLGFDGALTDDSTALVACRVSDGHLELLDCWEKPETRKSGRVKDRTEWRVDTESVDAAVAKAMGRFQVVGFYADPPHWQDYVDRWSATYGARMKVKATAGKPLEWWTNRDRAMVATLERFYVAVKSRALSYQAPPDTLLDADRRGVLTLTLRRHVLNARRRNGRSGTQIAKEYPKSPKKIDAAMAAVLAYEARADAVAAGVLSAASKKYVPKRIR